MHWTITILLSLISFIGFAQKTDTTDIVEDDFDVTTPPYWAGCESEPDSLKLLCSEEAILDFILENIQVPEHIWENTIVRTSFEISKKGEIMNIKTFECTDNLVNQEVLRLLNSMPNWTPGYFGIHPIKVRYMIPIHFVPMEIRD